LGIGYRDAYVTAPLMLVAVIGIACVAHRRHAALAVVLAAGLLPFAVQLMLLRYYLSRYLFAASWIVLFASGYALALGGLAGHVMRAALLVPILLKTTMLLSDPAAALHPRDAAEFLGSGPYSGFGVREAINFLRREAENGELLLLTDPYWGPPTDVLFAYLQGRQGIIVREAWWLQVQDERYPIVPARAMPVMKSQYQRVAAGTLDFPSCCRRIFYVTDTNYRSESDVLALQSDARLVARLSRPTASIRSTSTESVDDDRVDGDQHAAGSVYLGRIETRSGLVPRGDFEPLVDEAAFYRVQGFFRVGSSWRARGRGITQTSHSVALRAAQRATGR
jgi:hypothetical protein